MPIPPRISPPPQGPMGANLPSTTHHAGDASPTELLLDSRTLLQGQRAITIQHNGAVYRLQATRQGKLILTK